jgi:hypothetical protein
MRVEILMTTCELNSFETEKRQGDERYANVVKQIGLHVNWTSETKIKFPGPVMCLHLVNDSSLLKK